MWRMIMNDDEINDVENDQDDDEMNYVENDMNDDDQNE